MVKRKLAIGLSSQSINTTREQFQNIDNRPMVSTGKYSVPFKFIHFVVETHLGPAGRRQPNSLNRSGPLPRTVVLPASCRSLPLCFDCFQCSGGDFYWSCEVIASICHYSRACSVGSKYQSDLYPWLLLQIYKNKSNHRPRMIWDMGNAVSYSTANFMLPSFQVHQR